MGVSVYRFMCICMYINMCVMWMFILCAYMCECSCVYALWSACVCLPLCIFRNAEIVYTYLASRGRL